MKKIVFVVFSCLFVTMAFAQDSIPSSTSNTKKINLINKPGDHLMLQLSSDHWASMPDSISSHQSGFSRGFNVYFMYNKPLKNAPNYAIGIGLGVSTSNIVFKKMNVDLNATSATLPFTPLDLSNHFKKFKLATTYLEVPVELRYFAKPDNPNKCLKAAIGLKFGTLLNTHTKGKTLENSADQTINTYTEKENSKRYINGTQIMGTARIGYGIFSLFGSYGLTTILKSGYGANMRLFQVGITLSGL